MKHTQLLQLLPRILPLKRAVCLSGPPGIGKSQIMKQVATVMGLEFIDFRALLHDPTDLKFPCLDPETKALTWIQSCFPTDPKTKALILIDELSQAAPMMQAALLQLILDRSIGQYQLPENTLVSAAMNRPEDAAGARSLISPLLGRMIVLPVTVDFDDWQAYAAKKEVDPMVCSFLRFRPDLLHENDPDRWRKGQKTADPRAWFMVSDLLKAGIEEFEVVAGTVGEGAAGAFCGFVKIAHKLPSPAKILANPEQAEVQFDAPTGWALIGALAHYVIKQNRKDLFQNAFVYANRLPAELSICLGRDLYRAGPSSINNPAGKAWREKHADIIRESRS